MPTELPTHVAAAAQKGELSKVIKWLRKGGDVDAEAVFEHGSSLSLLSAAASSGQLAVVKEIVRRGADVNQPSSLGTTALTRASAHGHLAVVQHLLEHKAHVNLQDGEGMTTLMWTVQRGYEACARALLSAGADVLLVNNNGDTALSIAERLERVEHSVDQGQRDLMNTSGDCPPRVMAEFMRQHSVHGAGAAASVPAASAEELARVEGCVADLPARVAKALGTPREHGVAPPLPTVVKVGAARGDLRAVRRFLAGGGSVDSAEGGAGGATMLMASAQGGHLEVVELLLERKASVDLAMKGGQTALMHAAENWQRAVVQLLLRAGASKDLQIPSGETALSMAAACGYQKVVELLLRAGADTTLRGFKGRTARDDADKGQHHRTAKLIEQHEASPLAPWPWMVGGHEEVPIEVREAAEDGKLVPVAKWLTQAHGDIDARTRAVAMRDSDTGEYDLRDRDGMTLLMIAAEEGQEAVVRALLKRGASVNLEDDDGETALMFATDGDYLSVAQLLLDHGADVNQQTENNGTALHHAVCSDDPDTSMAKLLLERRANPDATGIYGHTPLTMAASDGRVTFVQELVRAGANLEVQDRKEGATAMDWAAYEGHTACVEALVAAGANVSSGAVDAAKREGHVETARVLQRARTKPTADRKKSDAAREAEAVARKAEAEARESARATAAAELAARVRRLEEAEAAAQAEERARERQRKAQIDAEREARKLKGEQPLSLPGPSHREPKRREESAPSTMAEQMEKQRWEEERPLRAAAFEERQRAAHAEAVERRERERHEAARQAEAEADKRYQEATHVLPSPVKLSEHLVQRLPTSEADAVGRSSEPVRLSLSGAALAACVATAEPVGTECDLPLAAAVFELESLRMVAPIEDLD